MSLPSLVTSRTLPAITSMSSIAARRSNAWRTSATVPLLLVCAMPVIAFWFFKYCIWAGDVFAIVVGIFAKRERSGEGDRRRRIALEENGVLDPVQRLDELCRVVDPLAIQIVGNLSAGLRDAIDKEFLVLVDDLVAGNADHALDVIERRVLRKAEHHHVASLRLPDIDDLLVDERDPDAVRELVDQDEVPDHQRRHHRARGNLEGLDQERAQQENDENNREETLRIFDPPGFLVVLAP